MNYNLKAIIICALLALVATNLKAQDEKSKFEYMKGISIMSLGDVALLGKHVKYNTGYNNSGDMDTLFKKVKTPVLISFLTIGFNNQFVVKKFGDDKSLSVNVFPTVALSFTVRRAVSFTLPVFLQFNSGNVSTFDTKKETGFTVGVGAEYVNVGLVNLAGTAEDDFLFDDNLGVQGYEAISYIQPAANIGYRFFNKNEIARELNFRYSFKTIDTYAAFGQLPAGETSALSQWFRLSYIRYIGY